MGTKLERCSAADIRRFPTRLWWRPRTTVADRSCSSAPRWSPVSASSPRCCASRRNARRSEGHERSERPRIGDSRSARGSFISRRQALVRLTVTSSLSWGPATSRSATSISRFQPVPDWSAFSGGTGKFTHFHAWTRRPSEPLMTLKERSAAGDGGHPGPARRQRGAQLPSECRATGRTCCRQGADVV